ncbi:FAD/NAD(P)-binding protein [Streptomyces sp. XD-27]|uniref:FAD/NAD(P)-binding protein n=1 Tax=Streptomyces sp. XD-27 TaxID=3062779 RepID=UPI00350E5982
MRGRRTAARPAGGRAGRSGPEAGAGTAYATQDPRHRLNVPAGNMSCYPDDAGHFLRWLVRHGDPRATATDFVPRGRFGGYLADALADAAVRARGAAALRHVRARATGCSWAGARAALALSDGSVLHADAAVLATGPLTGRGGWVPGALRRSPRFVADAWAPGALDGPLACDRDVLLVGTGLTAVDVALSLDRLGRTVHAVSRTGALPRPHAATPLPPVAPPEPLEGLPLRQLRCRVYRHVRRTVRSHGDWRPALDGLRPLTARLWGTLTPEERDEFLARDRSLWNIHRHRMAPATAEAVAGLRRARRLTVSAGQVASVAQADVASQTGAVSDRADSAAADLCVTLDDGRVLRVGWVVDCTGPETHPARSGDPLHRGLLEAGLAAPGPLGIGYATDADGRLLGPGGDARAPLWTLGAHRRGELWESTAIPEIRVQAARVAEVLVDRPAAAARGAAHPEPAGPMGLPPATYAAAAARGAAVRPDADR